MFELEKIMFSYPHLVSSLRAETKEQLMVSESDVQCL